MLSSSKTCDVIVIGGGVIGLSCARSLAGRGLSVTLFDRQECGREASWAGAGIVESGSWLRDDPLVRLQRISVAAYARFTEELQAETGIDPEYERCGSFKLIYDQAGHHKARLEIDAARRQASSPGEPILELLSGGEARGLMPLLADDVSAVLHNRLSGQVRNPCLLAALVASCRKLEVRIREHEAVVSLLRDSDRVVGVRTGDGCIRSGQVVLAAGAWSSRIDPALAALIPVHPVRGQIVLLQAAQRPFVPVIKHGRHYLVPRRDGRVLIGATQERHAGFDTQTTPEGVQTLLDLAKHWVPAAEGWKTERAWAGLRPGTPDNRPYLGPVQGWEGLWAATGHFRAGLTLAPLTAAIIADLLTTGRTGYDIESLLPTEDRAAQNQPQRRKR